MAKINVLLPTIFAAALIHNDYSKLSDDERHLLDEWLDIYGCEYDAFKCVHMGVTGLFTSHHALYSVMPIATDCSYFTFNVEGEDT